MIAVGSDTLVTITEKQFDVVLFAFSYVKSLENTSNLTSKQLSRLDSINTLLEKELSLERSKLREMDSIALNLGSIIKKSEKARKKEKLKATFSQIGLGLGVAIEAGIIMYLLLR